jgi:hypothetical protein
MSNQHDRFGERRVLPFENIDECFEVAFAESFGLEGDFAL